MNQQITHGIILKRTDYGEADRIITLLTPDHGKLRLMAKGVRRVKSKLAGGIELFSVSKLSFLKGRGEIGTLVSTQLEKHYGNIVTDISRTMLGYDLIKQIDKATEDEPEEEYFTLLQQVFTALDDVSVPVEMIRVWLPMQLLRLSGHTPNLQTDTAGTKLDASKTYNFDYDNTAFFSFPEGQFSADHIKFLRLGFSASTPHLLAKVNDAQDLVKDITPLVQTLHVTYIRI